MYGTLRTLGRTSRVYHTHHPCSTQDACPRQLCPDENGQITPGGMWVGEAGTHGLLVVVLQLCTYQVHTPTHAGRTSTEVAVRLRRMIRPRRG